VHTTRSNGKILAVYPRTVGDVFRLLRCHPWWLLRQWNWKAALLSSATRGGLFFAANLGAGLEAAGAALLTEFALRAVTSGFYGATTQAFRTARPVWAATLTVSVLLPLMTHAVEFVVHYLRGTPALAVSIAVSAAFTVVSTQFNLYAMRHDVLIVGHGSGSLGSDMLRLPPVIAGFIAGSIAGLAGGVRFGGRAVAAGWAALLGAPRSGSDA